jgi:hypothetical protein
MHNRLNEILELRVQEETAKIREKDLLLIRQSPLGGDGENGAQHCPPMRIIAEITSHPFSSS